MKGTKNVGMCKVRGRYCEFERDSGRWLAERRQKRTQKRGSKVVEMKARYLSKVKEAMLTEYNESSWGQTVSTLYCQQ